MAEIELCDCIVASRHDLDEVEQCIRDARSTTNSQQRGPVIRCSLLDTQIYMHARTRMLLWMADSSSSPLLLDEPLLNVHLGGGLVLRCVFLDEGRVAVKLVQRHADNDGTLPPVEQAAAPKSRVYKREGAGGA